MKKLILALVLASMTILLQAQEVMKVELKKGETVEYKIDDISRVYFDTIVPSDDDDIKTNYLIMTVGDKKAIEGSVVTAISENDFVASVEGGVVTANHVGATVIVVNEKHPVIVMVFSIRNSIPDPVLKWGQPKDTIMAYHTSGTIEKNEDNALSYKNCGDATLIGYTFDDNGGLNGALIAVSSNKSSTFLYYLRDRYFIYPERQSDGSYMGFDGYDKEHIKTVILYYPNSNMCVYMPYSSLSDNAPESRETPSKIMRRFQFDDE